MSQYVKDELSDEDIAAERDLYGPLTASVRELIDAALRSEADPADVRAAQIEIEAATARLRSRQIDGAYGIRFGASGQSRPWGNAVVGLRNAIAPPLTTQHDPGTGRSWSEFELGAAYEGPPGLAHGGVTALILDHMLGYAAQVSGKPGMTASLTMTYRRATPLGRLRSEAWVDRVEGPKTYAVGHVLDSAGNVTVEAEGLFILPRWAREHFEKHGPRDPIVAGP